MRRPWPSSATTLRKAALFRRLRKHRPHWRA